MNWHKKVYSWHLKTIKRFFVKNKLNCGLLLYCIIYIAFLGINTIFLTFCFFFFYTHWIKIIIIMSSYNNYFSVSWLLFTPLEHQMGSSRSDGTDFNMSPGFGRLKKDDLQIMRCACRALSPSCKELHSCVSLFLSISHLVCPGVGGESERQRSLPPTSSHHLSSPPNREKEKTQHPGLCPVEIDSRLKLQVSGVSLFFI